MNDKPTLDYAVARLLQLPIRQIANVTSEFINQLNLLLVEKDLINVRGLGRFNVTIVHQNRKMLLINGDKRKGRFKKIDLGQQIRVHFSCAVPLQRALKKQNKENPDV